MKKLILFDVDGTVCLGRKLLPCSKKVFQYLIDHNINYVFLTNNSSYSIESLSKKMNDLGIPCNEDNFYTCTESTLIYLNKIGVKTIYAIGVKYFLDRLSEYFIVVDKYDPQIKVDAVVASFDTTVTYEKIKDASLYIQKGAKFYATSMDLRCPVEDGLFVPDCGSICKPIEYTTGIKATYLGKPSPDIIYQVKDKFNVKLDEILMVGDRYYTDIMVGINAKVDTLAVLTGEMTIEEISNVDIKPTYVRNDIGSLIEILENN